MTWAPPPALRAATGAVLPPSGRRSPAEPSTSRGGRLSSRSRAARCSPGASTPFAAIQRPISSSTSGFVPGRTLRWTNTRSGRSAAYLPLCWMSIVCARDVQTHDLAEVVHVERQARAVAFADVVVLRRKRVALDGPRARAADGADECQPRERRPLGLVIFERQVAKAKELPPRGLVLAPVPLEEVCHEPTRLLHPWLRSAGSTGTLASKSFITRCVSPAVAAMSSLATPLESSGRGRSTPCSCSACARSRSSQSRSSRAETQSSRL